MRTKFREIRLSKKNKVKLEIINSIIQEYADDDYKMTLRQLYYQLVSRDIIPNLQAEYGKISKLLVEGRMGGIVNWEAIEDRLRKPDIPYWNLNPKEAIEDTVTQYRLNRQKDQKLYLEVWVEKDALSGVLRRVTKKYHVRLLVNRGYSSVTAVHDAYLRFKRQIDLGNDCKILYLGDHDPSGIDMIRDIDKRIKEMLKLDYQEHKFNIEAIALTMKQINRFNLPKNPAKLTDPRAKWYLNEFGTSSWEVDALDPKTLNTLLTNHIKRNINIKTYMKVLQQEETDKNKLINLSENF